MSWRRVVLASALSAAACGDDRVWFETPPGQVGGAMILSLEGVPNPRPPIARAIDEPIELILGGEIEDGAQLVVRVFDDGLEVLDLEEGEIELVSSSNGRQLPHERSFVRPLDPAESSEWQEEVRPPFAVSSPISPCPTLEVIQQPLDTDGEIGFVLAQDGERVWVGVRDGTLWEVTASSVRRLDDFGAEVPRDVGHRGRLGDFWLAGAQGRLYRARAETSSLSGSLVVSDPSLGLLQWLAGGELDDGGYEIFAKSQEGIVVRVRAGSKDATPEVDVLHRFDLVRAGRGGGIVWIEPGRAVAGSEWSRELVSFEGDEVSFLSPPIAEYTGVTAVTFIEPFRLLIGSSTGEVAALEDAWRYLGESGIQFLIHAIAPNRDSFFAMGTLGYVARYDPVGARFCEAQKVGQSSTYAFAELDGYVALVDTNPNRARTFVRFVRR